MEKNIKQRWSIRKTKVTVGSVLLGTLIYAGGGQVVQVEAEEVPTVVENQANLQVEDVENDSLPQEEGETALVAQAEETVIENVPEISEAADVETKGTTNGMTYQEKEETVTEIEITEIIDEDSNKKCVKTVTKTTTTTEVSNEFEATAEIDINGEVIKKVKSPENAAHDHTNPSYAEQYGPIDLEWNPKFGSDDTYRVNFGTNYAIENGKLVLTMPVEGYEFAHDTTDWLVNRYYNNANGKSKYDYLVYFVKDKTDEEIVALNASSDRVIYFKVPTVSNDNRTFEIDLGVLPARTAFSLQFSRNSKVLGKVDHPSGPVAKLTGNFIFDKGIELPSYKRRENALAENDTREAGITSESTWTSKSNETESNGDVTVAGEEVVTKNGYEYEVITTTEVVRVDSDQCGCDKEIVTTEVINRFKMNAESVMDTTLPDYSNNGYLTKVANVNNHPNVKAGSALEGPGNAEIQHWQTTRNGVTTQYWRPVLALDYAAQNGKWVISLPYEVTKDDITDATTWLTDRYYPVVTGKKYYSNYNTITASNILDKIIISGNQIIVDLGDIPARTALSLVIAKKLDVAEDVTTNPLKISYTFEGKWKFNDIELPSKTVKEDLDCSCACEPMPDTPDTPDKPEDPDTPDTPDKPENPDTPDMPDKPENPDTPDMPDKPEDPDTPNAPNKPANPADASQANVVGSRLLPETGEASDMLLFTGVAASILAGLGLLARKPEEE